MPQTNVLEPQAQKTDPRARHSQPPYPRQAQEVPGTEKQLEPKADHGEQSYRGFNRLVGKNALITGADSGIGRAVAIAFAREGANVAISYLNEEEDARETARWVKEANRKALTIPGDIGDQAHCRRLVDQTIREFGRVDILINNAAFQMTREKIEELSAEEFDRTFRTNVYAMFYLCQAVLPQMQPGNTIINTTSIQAFDAFCLE